MQLQRQRTFDNFHTSRQKRELQFYMRKKVRVAQILVAADESSQYPSGGANHQSTVRRAVTEQQTEV